MIKLCSIYERLTLNIRTLSLKMKKWKMIFHINSIQKTAGWQYKYQTKYQKLLQEMKAIIY